ncbi:MAG: selenium cofactor biosynthesis protein YqeC [Anaerolineaceae bacterium]|nr:selenium cofactor biosynthesis protein YqeC [Anaerolineaceae bacterium]
MNLFEILDFSRADRIAFVGSGGKTTALFQIARQFNQRVLITTTTHIGEKEADNADDHCVVREVSELRNIKYNNLGKILLITGPNNGEGKLTGLSSDMMEELMKVATKLDCAVLIEADGSRGKPLKAFASHEPVIPAGVSHIVVVAGISAIGESLSGDWVHRSEIFSLQTDTQIGKPVTLESVKTILLPPLGAMKVIPEGTELYLILNQADNTEKIIQAGKLAEDLINTYSKIAISSLKYGENVIACKKSIAGIILAGGESERLGIPKQLIPWRNGTFLKSVLDLARMTGLHPIIVVTGAAHNEIVKELEGQDVIQVENTDWKKGQSTSMKLGLDALIQSGKRVEGAIFLLVDQPQLSVSYLNFIIESAYLSNSKVIVPIVDGKRSTPVYFNKKAFPDLMEIKGDQGGRALFSKYLPYFVEWLDATMRLDCDTYEDLQTLRQIE